MEPELEELKTHEEEDADEFDVITFGWPRWKNELSLEAAGFRKDRRSQSRRKRACRDGG